MLFSFRALASGSSGNAFLLRSPRATILVEAGLRLPTLERYLAGENVALSDLDAVLVSHEHRDHCAAAADLISKHNVPVYANVEVLAALGLSGEARAHVLETDRSVTVGDVEVRTFPVPHDAAMPVGFLLRTAGRTIALATDVGHPCAEVAGAIEDADLIVLEANHDLDLLNNGRYPAHLRRRVAGPRGHLSNTQAAGLLCRHARRPESEVWLAHLSRENNSPRLALSTVRSWLKGAGVDLPVSVALRDRPSLRWTGEGRPRQLSLFEWPAQAGA